MGLSAIPNGPCVEELFQAQTYYLGFSDHTGKLAGAWIYQPDWIPLVLGYILDESRRCIDEVILHLGCHRRSKSAGINDDEAP